MRAPRAEDAAAIWSLVRESESLDTNSAYAYLLLCSDFADTSLVAQRDGELIGFALGYRPPRRPETLFVWQIGVAKSQRGEGLGGRLLDALLERTGPAAGVRFLEATVTPSNRASGALFSGFALRRGLRLVQTTAFERTLFPAKTHEEELRIRIGPID